MKSNANKGLPHLKALEYKPTLDERMMGEESIRALEEDNMKSVRQMG